MCQKLLSVITKTLCVRRKEFDYRTGLSLLLKSQLICQQYNSTTNIIYPQQGTHTQNIQTIRNKESGGWKIKGLGLGFKNILHNIIELEFFLNIHCQGYPKMIVDWWCWGQIKVWRCFVVEWHLILIYTFEIWPRMREQTIV